MLSTAALRRDKTALESILNSNPELLITEIDLLGYDPICHAIGWVEGLRLLLGVIEATGSREVFDEEEFTWLDHAIAYGCIDSIKLLLDSDMTFNMKWIVSLGTDLLLPGVSDIVFKAISKKLELFVEFSRSNLPRELYTALNIAETSSFDTTVRALLVELSIEDIPLPTIFQSFEAASRGGEILDGTVYHRTSDDDTGVWINDSGLTKDGIAVRLFNAGLTDVDCLVKQTTPLMGLRSPEWYDRTFYRLVEFFVERGGRLDRHIPSAFIENPVPSTETGSNYRVIHRLSALAWNSRGFHHVGDVHEIAELCKSRIWRDILQSTVSDPCRCACASGGCRPISLALKSCVLNLNLVSSFDSQGWGAASIFLRERAGLLDRLEGDELVEDIIRCLSFTALGLTHTCCRYTTRGQIGFSRLSRHDNIWIELPEPTEIEEIHQEEAGLIERLDRLVDGFVRDYKEQGSSLGQFLLGPWQEAMSEELLAQDEVPEPVREQWENIGVRIGPVAPRAQEKSVRASSLLTGDLMSAHLEARREELRTAYEEWMDGIRRSIRPV